MTEVRQKPTVKSWARVWAAIRPPHSRNLRAGAWYPVVRDDQPDRVTLRVYGKDVDVPRRVLEIRRHRPKHFTIVSRIGYRPTPGRKSLYGLGKRYVVCPVCAERFALYGEPKDRDCPKCGHEGEVGWWE